MIRNPDNHKPIPPLCEEFSSHLRRSSADFPPSRSIKKRPIIKKITERTRHLPRLWASPPDCYGSQSSDDKRFCCCELLFRQKRRHPQAQPPPKRKGAKLRSERRRRSENPTSLPRKRNPTDEHPTEKSAVCRIIRRAPARLCSPKRLQRHAGFPKRRNRRESK